LEKARREAKFPWLSANTYDAGKSTTHYQPYIVKEVQGVRVGVLGLTTPGIPNRENTSEEHTSELQSQSKLVCRLLLEKKKTHRSQRGIADALRTGYLQSRGDVLVFYPADLQFKPEDIPRLVAPIMSDDADMVTGFKEGQYDKQFVSGIYNGLSRRLFDVQVRDLSPVKAYRRESMDALPV